MSAPTTPLPTRTDEVCATGCRSILLTNPTALQEEDHHAYTCARCRGLVCALCGTTPVRWAGYVCRPCVAPAPAPLTARQLRAALAQIADEDIVIFQAHDKTWAVADATADRSDGHRTLSLIGT